MVILNFGQYQSVISSKMFGIDRYIGTTRKPKVHTIGTLPFKQQQMEVYPMLCVGHGLTEVNKMRNVVETIRHDGGMSSAESVVTEPSTVHVAGHTPFFPVLQRTCDNR